MAEQVRCHYCGTMLIEQYGRGGYEHEATTNVHHSLYRCREYVHGVLSSLRDQLAARDADVAALRGRLQVATLTELKRCVTVLRQQAARQSDSAYDAMADVLQASSADWQAVAALDAV